MSTDRKQGIALILLKEFYRILLLGLSVFFAYFLVARSNIFSIEDSTKSWVIKILYLAGALLAATVFAKSLRVFFWDNFRDKRKLVKVPSLLRQGLNVLIYAATLLFTLKTVFNVSITGILTATGALGVVVGLALKEIISDVFAGIIIGLDGTMKIGDWVRIEARPAEPKIGMIAEMNWRVVHIPHAGEQPRRGAQYHAHEQHCDEPLATHRSEGIRRSSSPSISTSPPSASYASSTPPSIRPRKSSRTPNPRPVSAGSAVRGVEYKVKYWIVPAKCGPGKARNFVIHNILYNLNQAGLSLSYPKSDVFTAPMPVRNLDIREDRIGLLERVELLSTLSSAELHSLAAGMIERKAGKGELVVRMGDEGDSMFILVEGLLNVVILDAAEIEVKVAQLKPGAWFGELSLLTGEPRSGLYFRPWVTPSSSRSPRPSSIPSSGKSPPWPRLFRKRSRRTDSRTKLSRTAGARSSRRRRKRTYRAASSPRSRAFSISLEFWFEHYSRGERFSSILS